MGVSAKPDPPSYEQLKPVLEQAKTLISGTSPKSLGEQGDLEYVCGVRNALMWVLGETELTPFEDDDE